MVALNSTNTVAASTVRVSDAHRAGLVAMLLGVALVFTVGFAQPQALHDAAHDTRHSLSFPCH